MPPLFFFLQRFFGDFATQSQSRVLPFFAGCFSQPLSSSVAVLLSFWKLSAQCLQKHSGINDSATNAVSV